MRNARLAPVFGDPRWRSESVATRTGLASRRGFDRKIREGV